MGESLARLRLAFLGSGAFGLPTLAALASNHDLRLVVSQPDRPAGRGMKLTATPIGAWVREHLPSVPLQTPEDVNAPAALADVRTIAGPTEVDAWVVIAFGQKLSEPLLEGIFACNLHASILPRWRGAAPINWSILSGDAFVGNSVITIAQRMDAGLVLATSNRPMDPRQTAGELHDALSLDGPALVLGVLGRLAAGSRPGVDIGAVQDESLVTRAKKLGRGDAWIDLAQSAEACRRRINGLSPWPGVDATLAWPGAQVPLKLCRAEVAAAAGSASTSTTPGALTDPKQGVVSCGDGSLLRLLEVQPLGSRLMVWDEFANGRRPPAEALLSSTPQKRV